MASVVSPKLTPAPVLTALRSHSRLKAVRGRGSVVQSYLAALRFIRSLEAELDLVRKLLDDAWSELGLDKSRDYRKFIRHTDAAQQRLHRVIKKVKKNL